MRRSAVIHDVRSKTAAVALALASSGLACSGRSNDDASESALWALRDTQWPSVAGRTTIAVCWESSGFEAEKEWSQTAVVESWGAVANIDFVGWGDCEVASSANVRVRIADETARVLKFGRFIDGLEGGLTMNFTFHTWNQICDNDSARPDCIRATAIHEFGHVLGFIHEQDRADAPPRCPFGADLRHAGGRPELGLTLGPYDPNSIMNYCNIGYLFDPKLSDEDIAGVRRWYGTRER